MNSPPTGGLSGQDTLHQAASAPGPPWGRKPAVTTVPTGNHNRRSTTVSARDQRNRTVYGMQRSGLRLP
jgi:hypothetical protein